MPFNGMTHVILQWLWSRLRFRSMPKSHKTVFTGWLPIIAADGTHLMSLIMY